uniref:hypothetical protein n=1 Tax=Yersinia kristensenii TaxID=28152 RepID=UPI000B0E0657
SVGRLKNRQPGFFRLSSVNATQPPMGNILPDQRNTPPTAGLTPFAWYVDTDFQATDMTGIEPAMFEVTVSAFFSYGEISAR